MSNILYVIPNGHLGGAERLSELLIKYHDRSKYRPIVAFLRDGPLIQRFEKLDAKVYLLPRIRMRQIFKHRQLIQDLKQIITSEKIALVHSSMSYAHFFAAQAARQARIPCVWFQHGPVGGFDVTCNLFPTACIFTNSKMTSIDQKKKTFRNFPIVQISPGIELDMLSLSDRERYRQDFRRKNNLSPEDFVLGFVGRFQSWKGQLQFLDALNDAQKSNPRLRAVFVGAADIGEKEFENAVRAKVAALGLQSKVSFHGFAESMEKVYPGLDALAHASIGAEPFGLVIAEAMAYGLPVIASNRGTPSELITDKKTGLLVDPVDLKLFSQALATVAERSPQVNAMAASGKLFVDTHFSALNFLRQIEEKYDSILGSQT